MKTERGSTTSQYVEKLLRKRLWPCRKAQNMVVMMMRRRIFMTIPLLLYTVSARAGTDILLDEFFLFPIDTA
jgi:hypothetical protein